MKFLGLRQLDGPGGVLKEADLRAGKSFQICDIRDHLEVVNGEVGAVLTRAEDVLSVVIRKTEDPEHPIASTGLSLRRTGDNEYKVVEP